MRFAKMSLQHCSKYNTGDSVKFGWTYAVINRHTCQNFNSWKAILHAYAEKEPLNVEHNLLK